MTTQEETIRDMITSMERAGWRITEQRKDLAALFAQDELYLSPKDVYDHMKIKYPTVSLDTVYRNLRLLSEMNVLEEFRLTDNIKYKARCQSHHHHHVICVNCEKTYTFEFCPMEFVNNLPEQFDVMTHKFEILGRCADCKL